MIQRIQSLYLFLTIICFSVFLFFPFATINENISYSVWSINDINGKILAQTYYLGLLAIIISILSIVTIFSFKKRLVQIKMCSVLYIFILLFLVLLFFVYPELIINKLVGDNYQIKYSFITILPVLPIIFTWFAKRSIIKDEKLIRYSERLR